MASCPIPAILLLETAVTDRNFANREDGTVPTLDHPPQLTLSTALNAVLKRLQNATFALLADDVASRLHDVHTFFF
jgi:hypothetical protein